MLLRKISCRGLSAIPLMCSRRCINMGDPSQLFTSPGGLMALLYGRTGPLGGSNSSKNTAAADPNPSCAGPSAHESRRGSRRQHSGRGRRAVLRAKGSDDRSTQRQDSPPPAADGGNGVSGGDVGDEGWRQKLKRFAATLIASEALWLAALVFSFSALWELLKSQKGIVQEKVKNFFFVTLEVRSSQVEYAMIMDWMASQPRGKGTRNLTLKPITIVDEMKHENDKEGDEGEVPSSVLVPGYGIHLFKFNGVRLWVSREVDSTKQHGNFAQRLDRENDVLTITFFTRRRGTVESFLEAVCKNWKEKLNDRVRIMTLDYNRWAVATERARRPMNTLYLPRSTKEVIDEIRVFYGLRETYNRLGIPWRRGYLFEGPPGTGKSSLILAIAGELGLPVCILPMQGSNMDDARLLRAVTALPPKCLLLLEDFENSILSGKRNADAASEVSTVVGGGSNGGVSLSGLLNALDGVASSEGRLLIMTSNDTSRLPVPDALLRPGRVDKRVRFDKLSNEQLKEMQAAFTQVLEHSADPILNEVVGAINAAAAGRSSVKVQESISPATFQENLLDNIYHIYLATSRKEAESGGEKGEGSAS